MLYLSEPQLLEIQSLDPLRESKFKYNSTRWLSLDQNLKSITKDYCDDDISREQVIKCFRDYFDCKVSVESPFVLTMIWGFADIGYGTFRTNKYYTSENMELMELAFTHVKRKNIQQAYRILKLINGLNINYISKLLYFSTRALEHSDYCLIFDIRVARALIKLTCPETLVNLIEVTPSNKFEPYHQYNVQISATAPYQCRSARNVFIFISLRIQTFKDDVQCLHAYC